MTRRPLSTIALAASLLLLATGCGGGTTPHTAAGRDAANSPPQLQSIDELRNVFNATSREPTLVVLVAPT